MKACGGPVRVAGFVRMRMVRVVAEEEAQMMFAAGAQGLVGLGPPRRYLIHPVIK